MAEATYTPMFCPAPRRASAEHPGGKWTSHPWTAPEVKEYHVIGGRFVKGGHDFADRAASIAAGVSPEKDETPKISKPARDLNDALENMSPEERQALLEKLA